MQTLPCLDECFENQSVFVNRVEFFRELNSILTNSTKKQRLEFKNKINDNLSKELLKAKGLSNMVYILLVIRALQQAE